MNIKKHIPNFLTCCNLLCGCVGILFAVNMELHFAAYMIFAACVFDFFDGFAARALKVSSPIGKDLDSLSDMVTFGVLPGMMIFGMLNGFIYFNENHLIFGGTWNVRTATFSECKYWLPGIAFLIPVFSALRLAKFNNDTRQSDRFIGLPTPANALFIAAIGIIWKDYSNYACFRFGQPLIMEPYLLALMTIILSILLVAELPLIALKFKNYGWVDNKMRYLLIISALILLVTLNITAIPIIIILYIILSLIENNLMRDKSKI